MSNSKQNETLAQRGNGIQLMKEGNGSLNINEWNVFPENIIDKQIGVRLRNRRKLLGMSQTKLAGYMGLSFQQIQKYENGLNKMSCSRMFEIAKLLQVRVNYFFDELGKDECGGDKPSNSNHIDPIESKMQELKKEIWKLRREVLQ